MQKDRVLKWSVLALAAAGLMSCGSGSSSKDSQGSSSRTYEELGINDPEVFPGFSSKIRLTPVSYGDLAKLHAKLASDLTRNQWNSCSERAHVWAFQLQQKKVDTGKVFIFYTGIRVPGKKNPRRLAKTPAGRDWLWHTAPYVTTPDGEIHVLENFHQVKGPMALPDWLKHQTSGGRCVELRGKELEIMKYTCGELTAQGECTRSNPNMIEVENESGVPCYYRRVPMNYVYPRDVANHDYLGFAELEPYNLQTMYFTCMLVMGGEQLSLRSSRCMDIVNGRGVIQEVPYPPEPPRPEGGPLAGLGHF